MLYTRKGDNGTTYTFNCDQRISKSSAIAEALGTVDEINSFLGLCKVKSENYTGLPYVVGKVKFSKIVHDIQETLFIIQAELAGTKMTTFKSKVKGLEKLVDAIEKILPPIKTFFISGGTELGATFDIARTISRTAERRVVAVHEVGLIKIGPNTLAYLNRLSSILYALARLSNHLSGIVEEPPKYK